MKTAHKRWWVWLPLLGIGGWLALFGDKSPAGDVAESNPIQPSRTVSVPPIEQAEALVALVPRDALVPKAEASGEPRPARDLFASRSWTPPPPPPPPPAPSPPPVAPPVPYTFVGKKLEGDTWEIYVTRADMTFVARQGQVLEGSWRVEKIEPPTMTLTYLPLEQTQTLAVGETR